MRPAAWPSSAISRRSPTKPPSTPRWRRCAGPSGSSTPNDPSPDPRPCSPISRATRTASPSPTRGSSQLDEAGVTLQMEGLPHQRPRPAQDHDARRRRVHPSLSHARAAERLPPHPPLRPVRQRRSRPKHRARPPVAGHARGRARTITAPSSTTAAKDPRLAHRCPCCGGRMIVIETFEGVRPARSPSPTRDQDRHLMSDAPRFPPRNADLFATAARRNGRALSSLGPQTLAQRRARAKPHSLQAQPSARRLRPNRHDEASGPRSDAGARRP